MKHTVRRILDNHRLLTTIAGINLVGLLIASAVPLSDRTFYTFLAAAVLSSWLALRAADRAVDRHWSEYHRDALPSDKDNPFAKRHNDTEPAAQTYDLTTGFLTVGDPEATSASETIRRGLTEDELAAALAEHGITRPAGAIRGRHTLRGGLQLTWTPSTTDTTGETR
jgi:hypothetical protein